MRPWLPVLFVLTLLASPLFAQAPAVATGSGTIGVAWRTSGGTIVAAVLSQSGDLLARLTLGSGTAAPAIAYDGVRYLAVWPNGTLQGRFFDDAGNLADPLPPHGEAAAVPPAISWNGADFVLAWLDAGKDRYWLETRTPQGTLENLNEIATGVSPLFFTPSVAIASSGTTSLIAVAWSSSDTGLGYVDAVTVDATLQHFTQARLDSGPIALYGAAGSGYVPQTPDVAASPTGFLVTWLSSNGRPLPTTLRAARVALDGTAIDATPLTVTTSPTSETDANPRVAWDGTKFFETWTRTSGGPDAGTWAAVITASGQVSAPVQIVGDTRLADVAGLGAGRDAIVWTNDARLDLALVGVATARRRAVAH